MSEVLKQSITIETERLLLRTVNVIDIEPVADSWNLDEEPISRTEAWNEIQRMNKNHLLNTTDNIYHLCLALYIKHDNKIIGWCGLDHIDKEKENPVIFYLLKKAYWNKGIATEAAKSLIKYIFENTSIKDIDGGCALDNYSSKRVMEKIGMKYLGLNKDGGHSFSINRNEYKNMNGNNG